MLLPNPKQFVVFYVNTIKAVKNNLENLDYNVFCSNFLMVYKEREISSFYSPSGNAQKDIARDELLKYSEFIIIMQVCFL